MRASGCCICPWQFVGSHTLLLRSDLCRFTDSHHTLLLTCATASFSTASPKTWMQAERRQVIHQTLHALVLGHKTTRNTEISTRLLGAQRVQQCLRRVQITSKFKYVSTWQVAPIPTSRMCFSMTGCPQGATKPGESMMAHIDEQVAICLPHSNTW